MSPPLISVCIPAYNRSAVLPPLLDSILEQDFDDYEIVICDDDSREREQIRDVVGRYSARTAGIHYYENSENLGFDGNLRELVSKATGKYVVFMGNDDLMCKGALRRIAAAVRAHPSVGVVLRSYSAFAGLPDNIVRTARYFEGERFFPAGVPTVVTFFRRCVVIPGVAIHRNAAQAVATDRFDGTTLYQVYLVSMILLRYNGVSIPDIIALYRDGGVPEFGNAAAEQGRYTPGQHTVASSLNYMRGMLDLAAFIDRESGQHVFAAVVTDIANYSYPILSMHSERPFREFMRYVESLLRMGFWRSPLFFVYTFLLLTVGSRRTDRGIELIKKRLGHTPAIGSISKGHITQSQETP